MPVKALFALSVAALLIAAAPPPPRTAPTAPAIVAPAEVAANLANHWFIQLSTGGTVEILLRPDLAPHHVAQFQALIRRGFYNGLKFHRVISGFMAQGGDPKGTGEGGSDLPDLKAEFTPIPFLRGTVGAARAGNLNSANSQFFIMFVPNSDLDNNYTVVGRVISGMDAVDQIAPGEPPAAPTTIIKTYLGDMAAAPAK
jgi:cyclophilin family peptidyl-prolyl cis-trans isomerase